MTALALLAPALMLLGAFALILRMHPWQGDDWQAWLTDDELDRRWGSW